MELKSLIWRQMIFSKKLVKRLAEGLTVQPLNFLTPWQAQQPRAQKRKDQAVRGKQGLTKKQSPRDSRRKNRPNKSKEGDVSQVRGKKKPSPHKVKEHGKRN